MVNKKFHTAPISIMTIMNFKFTGLVSEEDVEDILDTFKLVYLDRVYVHLGLSEKDISDARLAHPGIPREQAREILHLWRNKKAEEASRDEMIRAIQKRPECNAALSELKWGL